MTAAFALAFWMWAQQHATVTVGGPCWHDSAIQIATTSNGEDVACANAECAKVCYLPLIGTWVRLVTNDDIQLSAATQNPIDVPAVVNECNPNEAGRIFEDGDVYCFVITRGMVTVPGRKLPVYTCADPSRILLHSEDGKYWCHKVQP